MLPAAAQRLRDRFKQLQAPVHRHDCHRSVQCGVTIGARDGKGPFGFGIGLSDQYAIAEPGF